MSFDKAIKHGKERRKKYKKSKRFDRSCRNHGGCGYCKNNRMYQTEKAEQGAASRLKDWESGDKDS